MTNIIRTLLDVEIVGDIEPPKHQYRFCVDLELTKNYALPIVYNCQRQEFMVNLIDRIVASTAGLGVCLEVVAKVDPNATIGIQKFVYNKLHHKTSTSLFGVNILDPVVDLIGTGVGQTPKLRQLLLLGVDDRVRIRRILGAANLYSNINSY